jgi:hypothetical protein
MHNKRRQYKSQGVHIRALLAVGVAVRNLEEHGFEVCPLDEPARAHVFQHRELVGELRRGAPYAEAPVATQPLEKHDKGAHKVYRHIGTNKSYTAFQHPNKKLNGRQ